MNTTDVQIPDRVRAYVIEVIRTEEASEQYQNDPRLRANLRAMWEELNASPFYPPTGVDWSEVVADWEGDYVHDPDMTTDEIMKGLREIAKGYVEQTEYGECNTCGRAAWLGTVGDCSECEETDDE